MTILANTQPAFALTSDNDHGHRSHGISDKDQTVFSSSNGINTAHHTTHDLSRQVGALESGLLSAVYKNTFDLSVGVEKNGAAAILATNVQGAANNLATQVANSEVRVQAEHNFAALNLATVLAAKDALIQAGRDTASVLAAIAACCCESQKVTLEEGDKTRALIQMTESNSLRDRLAQAQTAIIVANGRIATAPIVV